MSEGHQSLLNAARATGRVKPQKRGDWIIRKRAVPKRQSHFCEHPTMTQLIRKIKPSMATLHRLEEDGTVHDVVMEDSCRELRRHLPAMLAAEGHVLKTGLGLGCFVRAILTKPEVERVTVIEIDRHIIDMVGGEFSKDPRVKIICADALEYKTAENYDFIWHDIWCPENDGLSLLHAKLIDRFSDNSDKQGAWQFPRPMKRVARERMQYVG